MRIFITGGTGFIGSRLITALAKRGHQVVALVRTYERARELPRGVRVVAGDLTKPESYRSQLVGCDALIHAAGATTLGPSRLERERLERINLGGSRDVREAALAAGVGRIVHLSQASVYGDVRGRAVPEGERPDPARTVTYAAAVRAQAQAEAMDAQAGGAPVIVVVSGQVYDPLTPQPADSDFAVFRRDGLWVLSGAGSLRCWTPVEQLAAGLCDVVEHGTPGAVYHLAGESRRVRDMAGATGPARLWIPTMAARGIARALRDVWPAQAERWRARAGADYVLDCTRAQVDLGWDGDGGA